MVDVFTQSGPEADLREMRFAALRCTNNQDFRFALIWSGIASLYEFVGAVKNYLAN